MTKNTIYTTTSNIIKKISERRCTPICGAEERKAYRQRKSVKKHAAILISIALIATLCMGSVIYAFAKEPINSSATHTSITVLNGDSLWSIAKDYFPENDPRDVIDEICSLNDLSGFTIYAGQTLLLPN